MIKSMKKAIKIKTLVNLRVKNKKYGFKRICWNTSKHKAALNSMTEFFTRETERIQQIIDTALHISKQ